MSEGFSPDPEAAALRTIIVSVGLTVFPMASFDSPSAFRIPPIGLLGFGSRLGLGLGHSLRLRLSHSLRLGVRSLVGRLLVDLCDLLWVLGGRIFLVLDGILVLDGRSDEQIGRLCGGRVGIGRRFLSILFLRSCWPRCGGWGRWGRWGSFRTACSCLSLFAG